MRRVSPPRNRSPSGQHLAARCACGCGTTNRYCSRAYRAIGAAAGEGRPISPAAEWLLDNYHLVEEQIREIRQDLPPSFYRLLPKLAEWAVCRLSTRVRRGLGIRRPHRQPIRYRDTASVSCAPISAFSR